MHRFDSQPLISNAQLNQMVLIAEHWDFIITQNATSNPQSQAKLNQKWNLCKLLTTVGFVSNTSTPMAKHGWNVC
jgi:hypothetical protein